MKMAFVDTTILVDVLLKTGNLKKQAQAALEAFERTELPVYAIKEFFVGALHNYAYYHNVLVESDSVEQAVSRIKGVLKGPSRTKGLTALDAHLQAMRDSAITHMTPNDLDKKYGSDGSIDSMQKDHYRLATKARIRKAWKKRRSVTTHVVEELSCFPENDPTERRGLLQIPTMPCVDGCAAAERLKKSPDMLKSIINALKQEKKQEVAKRRKTLKVIAKRKESKLPQDQCRKLGDAVFVILAPPDAILLTTNIKDFEPMARACNKKVMAPSKVIETVS